jgi:DNA invertase Pin-like site-specific DNA recombinase
MMNYEESMINQQAALFVRTAVRGGTGPAALSLQEDGAAIYANYEGLQIARTWRVQGNARLEGRKALREFVDYVKATPAVRVLLFARPDRIGRSLKDVLSIYELIEKYDKEVHFFQTGLKLDRTSTSGEKLKFDIEMILARQRAEDLRSGRRK